MKQTGSKMSRETALEILRTEANPKLYRDWYLAVLIGLYGLLVSSYGLELLIVFLCLATCIGAANYRSKVRGALIAKATLALLAETETE